MVREHVAVTKTKETRGSVARREQRMPTARKAPNNKEGATASTPRKANPTRKKAEGVAVPVGTKPVVNRTGVLGGKKNPAAADTGGGKVKRASGAIEAVGSERTTAMRGTKIGTAMSGAATGSTRGTALGTKTGMRGRKGITIEPGAMEGAENRMSRAIPVAKSPKNAEAAATPKKAGAAKKTAETAKSAPAKSSTERARMAARVSTGPKSAGKESTAKATGMKKRT